MFLTISFASLKRSVDLLLWTLLTMHKSLAFSAVNSVFEYNKYAMSLQLVTPGYVPVIPSPGESDRFRKLTWKEVVSEEILESNQRERLTPAPINLPWTAAKSGTFNDWMQEKLV